MTENEKRLRRCCFTGHRPEKLSISEYKVKLGLEKEIRLAILDGIKVFITGMAHAFSVCYDRGPGRMAITCRLSMSA